MIRQQIKLLSGFYWRPAKAASGAIDEGRLWFAVLAAIVALAAVQATFIGRSAGAPHFPMS